MASVNEYSTRYSEAIDSQQTTPADQWRLQSGTNKQGSGGFLEEWPDWAVPDWGRNPLAISEDYVRQWGDKTPGEYLSAKESDFHRRAAELYKQRLNFGIAREQARKDLPLSTYTEAYWKIDLHNLFHFLRLRIDSHAQLEIRTYANAIFKLIEEVCPMACETFRDYRLEAMQLSGPEIKLLRSLVTGEAIKHSA